MQPLNVPNDFTSVPLPSQPPVPSYLTALNEKIQNFVATIISKITNLYQSIKKTLSSYLFTTPSVVTTPPTRENKKKTDPSSDPSLETPALSVLTLHPTEKNENAAEPSSDPSLETPALSVPPIPSTQENKEVPGATPGATNKLLDPSIEIPTSLNPANEFTTTEVITKSRTMSLITTKQTQKRIEKQQAIAAAINTYVEKKLSLSKTERDQDTEYKNALTTITTKPLATLDCLASKLESRQQLNKIGTRLNGLYAILSTKLQPISLEDDLISEKVGNWAKMLPIPEDKATSRTDKLTQGLKDKKAGEIIQIFLKHLSTPSATASNV